MKIIIFVLGFTYGETNCNNVRSSFYPHLEKCTNTVICDENTACYQTENCNTKCFEPYKCPAGTYSPFLVDADGTDGCKGAVFRRPEISVYISGFFSKNIWYIGVIFKRSRNWMINFCFLFLKNY